MIDADEMLHDLEPVVERLLERHLATSKEWFPHEHVPYGRWRDPIVGEAWTEAHADLMLGLLAIRASGWWDDFWSWRDQRDCEQWRQRPHGAHGPRFRGRTSSKAEVAA